MSDVSMEEAKASLLDGLARRGWPHPDEDSNEDAIALKWGDYKTTWLTAMIRRAHFPGELELGSHFVGIQFSGEHVGGSAQRHGSIDEIATAIDQFRFVIMRHENQ